MNYELAKKLKDAGFPQHRHYNSKGNLAGYPIKSDKPEDWMVIISIPTLSELIEACGEEFECLGRNNYPKGNIFFRAYPTESSYEKRGGDCMVDCCGYESGDTPSEAVANLWLALNKK